MAVLSGDMNARRERLWEYLEPPKWREQWLQRCHDRIFLTVWSRKSDQPSLTEEKVVSEARLFPCRFFKVLVKILGYTLKCNRKSLESFEPGLSDLTWFTCLIYIKFISVTLVNKLHSCIISLCAHQSKSNLLP